MRRVAILAGATGLVGKYCLQRLVASPLYSRIVAIVRTPSGLTSPRVEERIIQFDQLHKESFDPGADVFCALGTTIRKAGSKDAFRKVDRDYPVALARTVLTSGARQFTVVSSVGAHQPRSNFYLQTKREMEDAIAGMPFQAVHIFRPSVLIGERSESRPAEKIGGAVAQALRFALAGPLRKYRPIAASAVAAAMVVAAEKDGQGVHIYDHDDIMRLSVTSR